MIDFLLGALTTAAAVVALIFLRYYQRTHDRFFLFFAASFLLEALGYGLAVVLPAFGDSGRNGFVLRFLSYLLILFAIYDKNFANRRKH